MRHAYGCLPSASVDQGVSGHCEPVALEGRREILPSGGGGEDQRTQEFLPGRSLANSLGKFHQIIHSLADRCRQSDADPAFRAVPKRSIGADVSPSGHRPITFMEVL